MTSRHLDVRQLPSTSAHPASKSVSSSKAWLAGFAALAIGIGAIGTWFSSQHLTDNVTHQEVVTRRASLENIVPLALDPIAADRVAATLDEMKLPPAERAQLQSALSVPQDISQAISTSKPDVRLASVTLWDTHAEDGDVVTLMSAGYRLDVVITHAPQVIAFPVDANSVVQIRGRRDGGGGITLGVRGMHQEILMPIISEGQTLTLPVLAR